MNHFPCFEANCDKKFDSEIKLKRHIKLKHSSQSLQCDFEDCDYKTSQQAYLNRHQKSHSGDKPYKCDFEACDYKSTESCTLLIHKRIHTGEKPFKCDFEDCDYKSTNCSGLNTHKRTHTGEKPYRCDFEDCDYKCADISNLTSHKKGHKNDKPFICDFQDCFFKSRQNSSLTTHKRTHTSENPFVCDVESCNFKTKQSGQLILHKRTHTNEKPFICDFLDCNFKAKQSAHLSLHKFSKHLKQYRYVCETNNCGMGFYQITPFKLHIKNYHNGQSAQRIKISEQEIKDFLIINTYKFDYNMRFTLKGINGEVDHIRQIDFIIYLPNVVLILEVDEKGHGHNNLLIDDNYMVDEIKNNEDTLEDEDFDLYDEIDNTINEPEEDCDHGYAVSCEQARIQQIITWLRTDKKVILPIGTIRYNPHSFKLNGTRQNIPRETREQRLKEVIGNWIPKGDEIQYMFYSSKIINNIPMADIQFHKEYDLRIAEQCRPAIVE